MPSALRFLSQLGRKLMTDLLPAALASALVGLIFSHLISPPAPNENAADMVRIVHDAQELALNYSRKEEDLQRQMAMTTVLVRPVAEPVRADAARTTRDMLPQRDAKPSVAPATRSASIKKSERQLASTSTSKLPAAPEPAIEKRQPGEPLVLSNFATVPPAPARSEGFFEGKWNDIVSVVEKAPHWAGSAAEFVLDLPMRAIHSGKPSPEADFVKVAM
jgi:hypothetical protein